MIHKLVDIQIGFETVTSDTPTLLDAKLGDTSKTQVIETSEQNHAGLIWDKCPFCGGYILIDVWKQHREKCACGAVKILRKGGMVCGWKKDGVEWIMC